MLRCAALYVGLGCRCIFLSLSTLLTIYGIPKVFSTLGAAVLVDRLGRRKLLLGSILAMAIALATIAICEIASSQGAGR